MGAFEVFSGFVFSDMNVQLSSEAVTAALRRLADYPSLDDGRGQPVALDLRYRARPPADRMEHCQVLPRRGGPCCYRSVSYFPSPLSLATPSQQLRRAIPRGIGASVGCQGVNIPQAVANLLHDRPMRMVPVSEDREDGMALTIRSPPGSSDSPTPRGRPWRSGQAATPAHGRARSTGSAAPRRPGRGTPATAPLRERLAVERSSGAARRRELCSWTQ